MTKVIRICPFCGAKMESNNFLNTVCFECNAKFYADKNKWMNRKTGEMKDAKEIKQYTIEPCYTDNEKITQYENGKVVGVDIISYWEVSGFVNCLECMGYEKAYDVDFYKERVREAEENLEEEKALYNIAIKNPLIKGE